MRNRDDVKNSRMVVRIIRLNWARDETCDCLAPLRFAKLLYPRSI